jgi:tRNA A-37 threonylcarbamoyl transferase component Bud32/tetratricopeptide (TPR) repeat protein
MPEPDQTYAEGAGAVQRIAVGAQLGRFTLRRVLGEGGMGVVWAAHDPDLDREIAIKLLRHHVQASAALRKRLLREARAMARLKHPNVITVYEVGSSGDTDFIAMELVEGRTLDDWLAHDPPRDDVWAAVLAAGRGLVAAHAAELVHRDFKPHNVLRARDGRVLVTDFGLARGLGEEGTVVEAMPAREVALDVTLEATPSRTDSLLDSPLTQTGAMIGTPAYMAPEQFHGAAPDPRTDQFAYCITVWQALTGARPFHGDTLEALRDATTRGVDDVVANLAKPVRAVLARGLDPDPAKRWPDMSALLEALERARKPPRRVWPLIGAVGAIALAINIFVFTRSDETPRAAVGCEPAERVFAEAWSDAARAELAHLPEPVVQRVAGAFEQFRDTWTASYKEACNAPPSKIVDARLACLRGVRDQAIAMRLVLREAKQLDRADVHGSLPNLAACKSATPVAPPEIPADQPRRGKVLDILARTTALRRLHGPALGAAIDALVAEATATGWKPLVPMVQVVAGNAHLAQGAYAPARALFRAATNTADIRFQALARIGLLEASVRALEKPDDAKELARVVTYARSATRAAGDDPMLAGSVAMLEAEVKASTGLWSRFRQPYKGALLLTREARREFEKAGDQRRAAQVALYEAHIYLARGDERALDDALFVVRSAEEAVAAAGLDRVAALDEVRAQLAFARGEYDDAHDRYDRMMPVRPQPQGVVMKGRVTNRSGDGVQATVIAWRGELHGDPLRVYTDPRFDGEIVETAADGTFEFHGGDAVIAVAGSLRSAPREARDGIALVVERTSIEHGLVAGVRVPLVELVARYPVGKAAYEVHAPIARDGTVHLEGMPRGPYRLGLVGPAGHGTRRTDDHRWPTGAAIEIIVRAAELDDTAHAWIFRGKVAPKTRAETAALAAKARDVAVARFRPIGADATEAGRETYQAGDVHAIVIGNAPGDVTVCVAVRGPAVYCAPLTVDDEANPNDTEPARVLPVLFKTGS